MQRLFDELLADERAVGVRGVDEIDAELDGTLEHADGLRRIFGLAPDAGTGDLHGSEAEAVDL